MATIEAINICLLYRDNGGKKTPDSCMRIAEVKAAEETEALDAIADPEDSELDRVVCKSVENCQGNPFYCCNPFALPDLLNIPEHRIS